MNPLRPLKKGWEYRLKGLLLYVCAEEHCDAWDYDAAPPICFADAKPEEPVREGNRVVVVMATEDGPTSPVCRFAGKHGVAAKGEAGVVWVRFDGDSSVWDISRRNLRREREDERPAEKKPEPPRANFPPVQYHGGFPVLPIAEKKSDPEGWMREFCPVPASAFADKSVLEATEASLLVWTGRRKENRARYGLTAPPIKTGPSTCPLCHRFIGQGGCDNCPLHGRLVCTDDGAYGVYKDTGDPEPMIAALEKCLEQEQAKHEPKPEPPKFALGQWVEWGVNRVRVKSAHYIKPSWEYILDGCFHHPQEEELTPCPPRLTDAQRRLQPGDKVRVREKRWDGEGKPVAVPSPKGIYKIVSSQLVGEVIRVFLEGNDCFGESLHNLDPAEEK